MLQRTTAGLTALLAATLLTAACGGPSESTAPPPGAPATAAPVAVEVTEPRQNPPARLLDAWGDAYEFAGSAPDRLGHPYIDTDEPLELVLPAKDEASLDLWRKAVREKKIPTVPTRYVISPHTSETVREIAAGVGALSKQRLPGVESIDKAGLNWEDPRVVVEVSKVEDGFLDALRSIYGGDLVRVQVTKPQQ